MRYRIVLSTLAAVFLVGCAGAGTTTNGSSSNRDLLTREEIEAAGPQIQTAYDAVQRLRPRFLRERSNPTAGVGANRVDPVVVYVNGLRRGGVDELRRIRVESVQEIHYIRPSDATTRFGMNHGSGAIEVTLVGGS